MDRVWVFGGIERNSTPPKCFFSSNTDSNYKELHSSNPGTTILSDCWKGYSTLAAEGYIHQTVNHSITFESDNAVHTNIIESRWNSLKKSLPKFDTTKALYNSYFVEYCIRCKYLDSSINKFIQFLQITVLFYKPKQLQRPTDLHISCVDQHTAAAQEPLHKQADSQQSTWNDVASSQQHDWRSVDTGNFDLKFELSDDSNDIFA